MSTLLATPDSQRSIMRLDVDFTSLPLPPDAYSLLRARGDTGARALVRQSPVTVSVTALYQQLNANSDFETNVASWTPLTSSGPVPTLTRDTTAGLHSRGAASMKMVLSTTLNTGPLAESEKCPVTPGQVIAVSGYVWTQVVGGNVFPLPTIGINWYDASNTKIGSTLGQVTNALPMIGFLLQPTGGQPASTNGYGWVAPAGAATATMVGGYRPEAQAAGTAYALNFDEMRLLQLVAVVAGNIDLTVPGVLNRLTSGQDVVYETEMPLDTPLTYTAAPYVINGGWAVAPPAPSTVISGVVTVAGNGQIWLKDPLAPASSLVITGPRRIYGGWGYQASSRGIGFLGVPDEVRKAFSASQDVNNRDTPMAQVRRRGAASSSLKLAPHSFDDRDALRALLTPGTQLLFQAPTQYGLPDRYLLFGDESVGLLGNDMRKPVRVVSLPFQVVDAPGGPAQAPGGYRWRDACRLPTSWGAVNAAGGGVYDTYNRTVGAGGLGTPDVGPAAWSIGTGTAANFSVSGGLAQVALPAAATPQIAILGSYGDVKVLQVTVSPLAVALTAPYQLGLVFRYQDASNYYRYVIEFGTANAVTRWIRRVGGVETTLISSGTYSYTVGDPGRIEIQLTGVSVTGWTWGSLRSARSVTPDTVLTTDGAPGVLANPGAIGIYASRNTGNTNVGLIGTFEDFVQATGPTWQQIADGALI